MADKTVESEVGELGSGNSALSNQEKQLPVAIKKTPLRDLHNESNIIAQKAQGYPLSLKEAVISESTKVSGMKRPSPESQMSHQHVPSSSGANGHLVYVRRKVEAEAGKANQSQLAHQEDGQQPKPLSDESRSQCLSAHVPIPTSSVISAPSPKPVAVPLENSNTKPICDEPKSQSVHCTVNSPSQPQVNKHNWEERYVQLQMYLKALDQSNLEDHLQMLRSLSASELNRHAIELEMRAIQLSLEQGRELQRVKALNVLGKQLKTSNTGPPAV